MNSIGKVLAELVNDFPDLVVILIGASFSDKSFKSAKDQKSKIEEEADSYSRAPCFRLS